MTTWRLDSMWTRTLSTTISTRPFCARGSSLAMDRLSHAGPVGRPQRPFPRASAGPGQATDEQPHERTGDEAGDVLEEGHAPAAAGHAEGGDAVDELEGEPQAQEDDRRALEELVEEAEEDERQHPSPRVQDDIRAEDRGDRPRRADHGRRGVRADHHLRAGGHEAAEDVEEEEAEPAEAVLDVVAEDPQVQHVADQVDPAAVEEHARQ